MKSRVCRNDVRVICRLAQVISGVRGRSRLSEMLLQAKGKPTWNVVDRRGPKPTTHGCTCNLVPIRRKRVLNQMRNLSHRPLACRLFVTLGVGA
jgi:hypothetical protein